MEKEMEILPQSKSRDGDGKQQCFWDVNDSREMEIDNHSGEHESRNRRITG